MRSHVRLEFRICICCLHKEERRLCCNWRNGWNRNKRKSNQCVICRWWWWRRREL